MAGLWYRTGTVDVVQGSKRVVGANTTWKTAINHPDKGNGFYGPDGKAYEIDYVTSDTELYLVDIYAGANASAQSYKIDVRGGTVPELSRQLSAHYAYMQGVIDSLQAVVNGAGDVTITGPDGQQVIVPSLANMLSKSGNLSGVKDKAKACENIGAMPLSGGVSPGTIGANQFDLSGSASLVKTGNEAEILGNYSVLIASAVSSVLAANAKSIDGKWGKFDNGKASTILASDGDKFRVYKSPAGSTNVFEQVGTLYSSLDKPTPAEIGAPALVGGENIAQGHTFEGMGAFAGSFKSQLHVSAATGGVLTWYKVCNMPLTGDGLLGGVVFDGEYGPWVAPKSFLRINMTSRGGCLISGLCSGDSPAIRAILRANGTTDVYFGIPPYFHIDGFFRWQLNYGFRLQFLDAGATTPSPGAGESLVFDTAANAFSSVGAKLLTSRDQTSGTWTPLVDGVTDFATRNGTYFKTGKLATVRAYVSFIGKTVPANNGIIRGIPFLPATPAGPGGYIPCAIYRGLVADPDMNAYMDPATGNIVFNRPVGRGSVSFESNADYMFLITYEIA